MKNVWILVGLIFAVTIILFLILLIESLIYCKIEEFKERKMKKRFNNMLNEASDKIEEELKKIGGE